MRLRGRKSERGVAIIAALWAAAIFAVIVLSVMQIVRAESTVGRGRTDVAQLNAIADAAVNLTILSMLGPSETQPPTNGILFTVPFADHVARVRVVDEAGKIDLNMVPVGRLSQLLMTTGGLDSGAAEGLAAAINSWRGGPLPADGHAVQVGHSALFQSVGELQLVPGMTQGVYRRIAPLLTVYSYSRGIDPSVASAAVLNVYRATDASAEAAWRRHEEERLGLRMPEPSPGVSLGHAFTITADVEGAAGARVVRTAAIRLTSQATAPLLIYRWN